MSCKNKNSICVLYLILIAGCITPEYVPTLHYTIEPEINVEETETRDNCLAIRTLESSQTYKQQIFIRKNDFVLDAYPNAKWADLPKETVTQAITDAIIATKRFRDVANAADFPVPSLLLTGKLRNFEEVRTGTDRYAQCVVRLELRTAKERDLLWAKLITANITIKERTVEGTVRSMNKAVAQVAEEVSKALSNI